MGAGGSRAGRSGRWVLRAGSSARCRYAAARRRKMTGLVLRSMGELTCPEIPRRLVMAPRLRRSPSMVQVAPVGLRGEGVVGGLPKRAPARGGGGAGGGRGGAVEFPGGEPGKGSA